MRQGRGWKGEGTVTAGAVGKALHLVEGSVNAESLGYEDPFQVQLLRPRVGPVCRVDDLSILVNDAVADRLRTLCPKGLVLEPTLVWAPQPTMGKRLDDRFRVSSKHAVHLLASLVERRPDGLVKRLMRPWILERDPLPSRVEVFFIAEHPRMVLFTQRARDILREEAPRLTFEEIPFATAPV